MVSFGDISGLPGPGLEPAANATAQEIAKALFLAGKIKCDCEVCKLLISAGSKMVNQLANTTGASPAAGEVPPGQPAADQGPGG